MWVPTTTTTTNNMSLSLAVMFRRNRSHHTWPILCDKRAMLCNAGAVATLVIVWCNHSEVERSLSLPVPLIARGRRELWNATEMISGKEWVESVWTTWLSQAGWDYRQMANEQRRGKWKFRHTRRKHVSAYREMRRDQNWIVSVRMSRSPKQTFLQSVSVSPLSY